MCENAVCISAFAVWKFCWTVTLQYR